MNRKEILKFIEENQGEHLWDFYNKIYDNLIDLNRRIDRISFYLIIIVFFYFISVKLTISSIQIGPISISDISILPKLLPLLFSYLLYELALTSGHKAEVFITLKFIFLTLYKQEVIPNELEYDKNNFFTRLISPFSYSLEIGKFNTTKSCIGAILVIPLISLIFIPFYIEYRMLKDVFVNYWYDIIGKLSFCLSIWILLMLLYYYLNLWKESLKNQKLEKS